MDKELEQFFIILHGFRKLQLFDVVPDICQGDYLVLNVAQMQSQHLEREGKTKVSAIVREMQIPAPAVSRALKNLEERGLVSRMVDDKDRRNTYVMVTEEGKKICDQTNGILKDFVAAIINRMGKENMQEFNQNLMRFQSIVTEEIDARRHKGEVR